MLASRQEAIDLLHKWFEESTPVTVLLASSDASVSLKVTGFVNSLASNILVSDGSRDKNKQTTNYLIFPADFIEAFQFIEATELQSLLSTEQLESLTEKKEFACLSLTYESGSRITIFER